MRLPRWRLQVGYPTIVVGAGRAHSGKYTELVQNERTTVKSRYHPGYRNDTFSELAFVADGGSLDGKRLSVWPLMGTTLCVIDELPAVQVAVRATQGGATDCKQLCTLDMWVTGSKLYEESKAYANRLVGTWHIEYYVFAGWHKGPRKWARKVPHYRFHHADNLVPAAGDHSWHVKAAGLVLTRPPNYKLAEKKDRWAKACQDIEATANAFSTLASLVPAGALAEGLAGPAKAVELSRLEARRLAGTGRQLEAVPCPGPELQRLADEAGSRLDGLRSHMQTAVAYMAELAMAVPSLDAGTATSDMGTSRLHALREAMAEVLAVATPEGR